MAESDLNHGHLALADVVFSREVRDERWIADTLAAYPGCAVAAVTSGSGGCLAGLREGAVVELEPAEPDGLDPAVLASALYGWLAAGRPLSELGPGIGVTVGTGQHPVSVKIRR